jgi:hypothetical protein
MNKLVSGVIILVVAFFMIGPSEAFARKYGQVNKNDREQKKTMDDTFGSTKPLSPAGSASSATPAKTTFDSAKTAPGARILNAVAANPISWNGQTITFRTCKLLGDSVMAHELSYMGSSNMYRVCVASISSYNGYPLGPDNRLIVFGENEYCKSKIVFSGNEKDAYIGIFQKIGEWKEQAKKTKAASFVKDIPIPVDGCRFVFKWESKQIPPPAGSKNTLELPKTVENCLVTVIKTSTTPSGMSAPNTVSYDYSPESFGEFLKLLTSKNRDIVAEYNKRKGTPSDSQKSGQDFK